MAWLRHNTTDYDTMAIPKEKGARRKVRRRLAQEGRRLLATYRSGDRDADRRCLLYRALHDRQA